MSKTKKVVNVEQQLNPRYGEGEADDKARYVYRVKSLKNLLDPAVGNYVGSSKMEQLINSGIEVNISQSKE